MSWPVCSRSACGISRIRHCRQIWKREAADLVGHHPGDSTWSSVDIETLDRVEEAECVDAGEFGGEMRAKERSREQGSSKGNEMDRGPGPDFRHMKMTNEFETRVRNFVEIV